MGTPTIPVAIIGAGPTGLTAAALLGQYGIRCLVLSRWDSVYPLPRAVHLDDEVYRILARLGLREQFAARSWPCRGLRLVDSTLRVLAEFPRTAQGRNGYPQDNMFEQPQLEELLRANLAHYPTVALRGGAQVTAVTQDADGVRVEVINPNTGEQDSVYAQYVLGCDGAHSLARAAIGATMRDLRFTQRWLIADVATEADLGQWEGVHQVSDPQRAGTYMRVGKTHYRWEFQLAPGETVDDYREMAHLHPLISPWTKDLPAEQLNIIRMTDYTFRAQVANRWRDDRVFLLGDAAHLTPPFIGQGMGAGLRDAMNLAWKLAGVLDGTLPDAVLDTYQIERKPHVRTMILRSVLLGTAMTHAGELGDVLRRVVAPRLRRIPGLNRQLLTSETPALHRSAPVLRPALGRALAGTLCPNAILDDNHRFDDVAAGRFALVTSIQPSAAQRTRIQQRGAVLVAAPPGSQLHRWLAHGHAHAALVRPDSTVLGASRHLALLCATLPAFTPNFRPTAWSAP